MGLRIFLHSINLVFKQLGDAMRISALLYVVSSVVSIIMLIAITAEQPVRLSPQYLAAMAAGFLTTTVIGLWIAVSWHRFVLLSEEPETILPAFHGGRMLAYLGRMFQALLLLIPVVLGYIVLSVLLGLATYAWGAVAVVLILIVSTLLYVSLTLVVYRMAPVFPGAAIGKPISIGDAWASTDQGTGALLVLAAISLAAGFILGLPAHLLNLLPVGPILSMIWLLIIGWIQLMVGISILTTIHGIYVEKRSIA